ncbi:hypothetical protein B0T14DRAFT_6628 [Immersiella caudata]|uniref:Uncharacterized protein n=1 Tax=Immersiella caudata TaxID=314043 RepID=A0AA40CAJ7_9PEZI|nr:hypothetical protein B0T14DRAFT_6628 [Immersiella caudata]
MGRRREGSETEDVKPRWRGSENDFEFSRRNYGRYLLWENACSTMNWLRIGLSWDSAAWCTCSVAHGLALVGAPSYFPAEYRQPHHLPISNHLRPFLLNHGYRTQPSAKSRASGGSWSPHHFCMASESRAQTSRHRCFQPHGTAADGVSGEEACGHARCEKKFAAATTHCTVITMLSQTKDF